MEPNVLNYARPDPPRPRNLLVRIGIGVWLVGWVLMGLGAAFLPSRSGATLNAIGFDLILIAFMITLLAGVLGQRPRLALVVALLEIATRCMTARH